PVCGPWSNLCKRGPLIDPSKEISAQRPNAAFPIMRKKFRSVRRDIYIHRAIAFAAFARQTEIKRLFHFFTLPAIRQNFRARHLPEQMRAAARRMLFLTCHHVARTHRVLLALAVFATASPHANASFHCLRVFASVLRKSEMSFDGSEFRRNREPQILFYS